MFLSYFNVLEECKWEKNMDLKFLNVKTCLMYRKAWLLRHYAPISYHYGNTLGSVEVLKERKDVAGLLIVMWVSNCFIFDFLMLVMIFQSLVNTSEGQLTAVGLTWLNPGRNQKCLNTAHSDLVIISSCLLTSLAKVLSYLVLTKEPISFLELI